jgi:hypothetical protein
MTQKIYQVWIEENNKYYHFNDVLLNCFVIPLCLRDWWFKKDYQFQKIFKS